MNSSTKDTAPDAGRGAALRSGTSLRSRWNRAFAVLFAVLALGATANVVATRLLVGAFRTTAVRDERDGALRAQVRTEIAAYSGLVHRRINGEPVEQQRIDAAEAAVAASFEQALSDMEAASVRDLLQETSDRWEFVAAGPTDHVPPITGSVARHQWLDVGTDEVTDLLTQVGVAGRAATHADLVRAAAVERAATAALVAFGLLMSALMLRFARRLSVEVLRPVGLLRDSANQLAAGELDHRVDFDRADELGELAAGFNAMADAIAGSQRNLSRQANHDSLTGLVNRAAFRERLAAALCRPERREGIQAVLFVDLDDFKDVNDTLGHAAGDALLRVVATRLHGTVRAGDLVARLGGDEFALLLDGCADADVALGIAQRAVAALAAPVEVNGAWVHVGASVGLAVRRDDSDPDSLMREADVAMYMAKGRGKNRVERYDASLNDAVVAHHALKAEVADAAALGELVLEYQPVVNLTTGEIEGVEALVRWQHPTRGLLPPSAFIDLAEKSGAIVGIGAWVLETAARQLQSWQRRYGLPQLTLAVNVSVCQLEDPAYAAQIVAVLRRTGVDPESLVLEVTESVLADPAGGAAESLEAMRRLGVRVALDDFGTGYSSIGYLHQLPVDILKIDRSFVSGDHAGRPGDLLLEAIVGLAQRLGLDVIPEGIEEMCQLDRLRALGCRTGQGFLMSRPVPASGIDELLAALVPLLPFALTGVGPRVQPA